MTGSDHTLIVADGDTAGSWLAALVDESTIRPLIIAADGGAAKADASGYRPDMVVGDLDSLRLADRERLEDLGVEFRVADRDKDESDMELCLLAALESGARRISILGALGLSRPEHSIANLLLLADPRLDGLDVEILARGSRIVRIGSAAGPGVAAISGREGDFVSLFPLGSDAHGVTTEGLRFPLRDETLSLGPSRGLSNELLASEARISSRRGCLLVVHTERAQA
jgi:thiamine pyrophosphokinase